MQVSGVSSNWVRETESAPTTATRRGRKWLGWLFFGILGLANGLLVHYIILPLIRHSRTASKFAIAFRLPAFQGDKDLPNLCLRGTPTCTSGVSRDLFDITHY